MRAELVELHQRLRVTTVFVTHDQVEAMTLGERVAVLNDGKLLQIDTPREVFARPADLFVASFIGSPAMNFLEVGVGDGTLSFGDQSIEIPDASLPVGRGDRYILGVRPQGFERASGGASIRVEATVVEDLGTESFVHFDLDVPSVAHTLRLEDGAERLPQSRTRFVARLDSKHAVRNGERLDLSLDPDALYYFDPDTHRRVPRRAEVERGEMASNV
jgi:multiple sugar transport system ATP-binding protein